MIQTFYRDRSGTVRTGLTDEEIVEAAVDAKGLLWVSLEQASQQEILLVMRDLFHFHPLAVEDCLSTGYQVPKVDQFSEYLFIIIHALQFNQQRHLLHTIEFNCFLGRNYLVTSFQEQELCAVKDIWKRLEVDDRIVSGGADALLHTLVDAVVDEYLPVIDTMDDEIDQLEDEALARPRPQTLQRILELKHNLVSLRRMMAPQREVINRLSRDACPQIDEHMRIYFRDIYDHIVRMHDLSESLRDVLAGALDIYLSSTSNKMNEVMKTLTLVSTIFLPLTFIAGVYGMNFDVLPELHWRYSYFILWGVFIAIAGGMVYFFKRRGWL